MILQDVLYKRISIVICFRVFLSAIIKVSVYTILENRSVIMQNLEYSVLMSVYYKEKPEYLSLSIQSMLEQTVKPNEFVIVKDGPLTPELDSVIDSYVSSNPNLFKIISSETNLGLGLSLAKGITEAKNELIARMDSDDYVVNTRCEKQLKLFADDPDLCIVGSFEAEFVDEIDNVISVHKVP